MSAKIPWAGRVRGIRWFYWRAVPAARAVRVWMRRLFGPPAPGSRAYRAQVREEIDHYSELYEGGGGAQERLFEPVPAVWEDMQRRAAERIRTKTGMDVVEHVVARLHAVARLEEKRQPRLLSLGSGPGGVEMVLAQEFPDAEYLCLDLNPEVLRLGEERARREGLPLRFQQADLNAVRLEEGAFDIVFCHASLHHLIAIEHVFEQVRRALRPGGELLVVDIITRNGYLMWPETRKVVQALWKTLPPRYRLNHTGYAAPRVDDRPWESDTRRSGMECVRSEEILPLLRKYFGERLFVPYMSISRRFFDTMYGANYDLTRPLDRAIAGYIWELDCHYVDGGLLRPESFFGIYSNRT